MNSGKTVLAQILAGMHGEQFGRCAELYPMKRATTALSAYDHFVAMVFAPLTYRESLREIEACLASRRRVLYHSGIRLSDRTSALLTAHHWLDEPVIGRTKYLVRGR